MARLAAIVESSSDAIIGKTLDGTITSWNAAAERIYGYTASEAIGQPINTLIPEDRADEEHRILKLLRRGKRVNHFETVRVTRDGRHINVSLAISPIRNSSGKIIGVSKIARDITPQKHAEEALRAREAQFRILADSIPQLAWMAQPDGYVFWYNRRWYDYTGTTVEQMAGRGWESVVAPADLPMVAKRFEAALLSREPWEDTFQLRRHDGQMRWHLSRALPLKDEHGAVLRWFGTNTDITEQREAELALRASEDRMASIVNTAVDGILSFDEHGKISLINPACLAIFGYDAGEVLGQQIKRLIPEAGSEGYFEHAARSHSPGHSRASRELSGRRKDGTKFPIELSVGEGGETPQGGRLFIGIVREITERRRTENEIARLNRELRKKVSELEALFAVIPIGIAITADVECREIKANSVLEQMLETSPGANISRSVAPNGLSERIKFIRKGHELTPDDLPMQTAARTSAFVKDFEMEVAGRKGGQISLLGSAAPLLDEAGHTRGAVGVFWDISDLKQAEEIRIAKEAAEAANRAKDDFLATLSHELRTPLGAVLLWAKLLHAGKLDKDQQQTALKTIIQSATEQSKLIEDLLDTSRALHNKISATKERLNFADTVRMACNAVRPAADARQITLSLEVPEMNLSGDPSLLHQVVSNLLVNAIKFTPEKGRVEVRLRREEGQACLEISDNGIGISADFLPHVFERFSQVDRTTTRRVGGLGLGLSIVRHIVHLHGGTVHAASEGLGRGTTFTVLLPLDSQQAGR